MMNLFDHQKNFINLFFFNLLPSYETICNIKHKIAVFRTKKKKKSNLLYKNLL